MFQGKAIYAFDNFGGELTEHKDPCVQLKTITTTANELKAKETEDNAGKEELNQKENGAGNSEEFQVPRRTIIVEPVMMMLYMFHMSSIMLLNSQYIYKVIGDKYNLSELLAAEEGKNNSDEGGGACGDSSDGKLKNTSAAFDAQQKAQAEAAMFNFYLDLISDVPGFFLVLFYGTFMDQYGRKPAMIIPMIGVILRAVTFPVQMVTGAPIEFLFLSGLLDAASGGGTTLVTAVYAYYADTIPPEKRGKRLLITDVVFGLSFAVMNLAFGYIIEAVGFFWSYIIVIGGHTINLLYIIFFVPESMKPNSKKSAVTPMFVIKSFKVLGVKRPLRGRSLLILFTIVWVMYGFGKNGVRHIDTLYRLNTPFCWTPSMMSIYTSGSFVILMLGQLFFGMVLLKPLGNMPIIMIGFISTFASFTVTAFSTTSLLLWIAVFAGIASNCQIPVMRAVLSMLVESGEQGALNATISSIDKIAGLISSFFFNFVYSSTLYFFRGTVYIIASTFIIISLLIMIVFQILFNKVQKKKAMAGAETVEPPIDSSKSTE